MKRIAMFIMALVFTFTAGGVVLAGEATPATPARPATPAPPQKMDQGKAAKKRVRKHRQRRKRGAAKKSAGAGETK